MIPPTAPTPTSRHGGTLATRRRTSPNPLTPTDRIDEQPRADSKEHCGRDPAEHRLRCEPRRAQQSPDDDARRATRDQGQGESTIKSPRSAVGERTSRRRDHVVGEIGRRHGRTRYVEDVHLYRQQEERQRPPPVCTTARRRNPPPPAPPASRVRRRIGDSVADRLVPRPGRPWPRRSCRSEHGVPVRPPRPRHARSSRSPARRCPPRRHTAPHR